MTYRKPVRLGIAIGFAASLACASAFAGPGGEFETEAERIDKQRELRQQEMQQERVRPGAKEESRLEQRRTLETPAEGLLNIGLIDTNRDELISEDEYKEWQQSMFGKLDADRNGELTELEYIVMVPAVSRLAFTPAQLANHFQQLDVENTGKVSVGDYVDVTRKDFEKADTNQDGEISLDELRAYMIERG